MKSLALSAFLLTLSSLVCGSAFGYQEHLIRNGTQVWDTLTASASDSTAFSSELAPIPGNFYAYSHAFLSTDLSCDQFLAQVKQLATDWNLYSHLNLYMLTYCRGTADSKPEIDFVYAIDAWVPAAVTEDQAFLKAHQGAAFLGEELRFQAVRSIDVQTILTLAKLTGSSLTAIHSATHVETFSGTDLWFPHYNARLKILAQNDKSAFLSYVMQDFGSSEATAFDQALAAANFVDFSDFFTLHLENGQSADFWLGFGGTKNCGTQPCFSSPSLLP